MSETENATITRKQIRDIFRANKGEVVRLAKKLKVSHVTVSLVLKGTNKSARVLAGAHARAIELLGSQHVA